MVTPTSKRQRVDDFATQQADLLQTWTELKICSWLLAGFSSGVFDPIKMLDEPSAALQIHRIFCASPPQTQARIKAGTARAILEWTAQSHAFSVLAELARVAAHIRASETVPHLAKQLAVPALRQPRSDEAREARDFVVGVLCGFAPLEQARPILLSLYQDPAFYEYGASLFLSLCSYDLERFVDHVPQFVRIVAGDHDFALDLVMDGFLGLVPDPMIKRALPRLLDDAPEFVGLLWKYTPLNDHDRTICLPPSSDRVPGPAEVQASIPLSYLSLPEYPQRMLFKTQHDAVRAVPIAHLIQESVGEIDERFQD